MFEFLIFNTQKRYEKQKNFGNFLKNIATFWQLLDTFIGNFLGIHQQLVAKPTSHPGMGVASCSKNCLSSGQIGHLARMQTFAFFLLNASKCC